MDKRSVSMEVEDNGLVLSEQAVEGAVRKSMRMFPFRHQAEQIDDVDESNLHVRAPLSQDRNRGQRFRGRNVARTRHYHIRLLAGIVAGEVPDPDTLGAC